MACDLLARQAPIGYSSRWQPVGNSARLLGLCHTACLPPAEPIRMHLDQHAQLSGGDSPLTELPTPHVGITSLRSELALAAPFTPTSQRHCFEGAYRVQIRRA